MEHDLVLEGRVVTPGGVIEAEVGVSDGRISEIGHGVRGSRRIRAERCLIFPGFVDIHVHLREPGWERKEDFRTGTLAAVHGGVTTVVDMPNNPDPTVTSSALGAKRRLAQEKAVTEVKFYGGVLPGRIETMEEIAGGVAGYKVYLSKTTGSGAFPESDLGVAFVAAGKAGKPVSLHCESQGVIDRRRTELEGVDAPYLHSDVRPPEAETDAVGAVVSALRRTPGVRANVCHASTGETVRMVGGARAEGLKLHCEAALHHLYFNRDAMLETKMLKTNPPLRGEEDRQSMLEGIANGGASFLVTDHAPHLVAEKLEEGAAGVPGLDDYSHVVSWLMKSHGVDPLVVARVASSNPSNYLRLEDRGEISIGKRADFTVLDMHASELVSNDDVQSRCGWSPYEGREFPGRARWTISEGRVLLDDFEMAP